MVVVAVDATVLLVIERFFVVEGGIDEAVSILKGFVVLTTEVVSVVFALFACGAEVDDFIFLTMSSTSMSDVVKA